MLIPSILDIDSVNLCGIVRLLVVEKEATFRSIIASPFWQKSKFETVLITVSRMHNFLETWNTNSYSGKRLSRSLHKKSPATPLGR
jgi:hypothetical protein